MLQGLGVMLSVCLFAGPFARTIEKVVVNTSVNSRPVVTGFVAYVSETKPVLMHCFGREDYSDGYDDFAVQTSNDHGRTWSEPRIVWKSHAVPGGRIRFAEPAAFWDQGRKQLCVLIDKSLYPNDKLTGQIRYQVVQYINDPATGWSKERPLDLGARSVAVSFSFPLWTSRHTVLVPAMMGVVEADGKVAIDPRSRQPIHQSVTIRGERTPPGEWSWSLGQPVPLDRSLTTRGFDENTLAELSDGRIVAVLRGSNAGAPNLPGHKWVAFSKDDGRTWSSPEPVHAADGTVIHSGANGSAFLRRARTGKLYWLGNLCARGEPANGNFPRHTLSLVEVVETPLGFRLDNMVTVDQRGADDPATLQLSNFRYYEDRETGDLVIYLTRYSEGGRDWRLGDYYRYRVAWTKED